MHPVIASRPSSRRGSVLILALVLSMAVGMVIAAILSTTTVETRLNERHFLSIKANNAAESVVDYGLSQLIKRWDQQTNFRNNELSPSSMPLQLSDELTQVFSAGDVAVDNLQLVGGVIPPNIQFFVNPNDPANRFDHHKGKVVLARDVEIYGKARVTHPVLGSFTAHAMQNLQLRDAPLFSHAIFYNMDLEFHPGPDMTITGPVHANGNIWAVAKANLWFTSTVTSAKDFRVSMARKQYQGDWRNMPGEETQSGKKVYIKDLGNQYRNPYKGSGDGSIEASYYTSVSSSFGTNKDWREFASNKWGGNLQSKDHEIPSLNPVGYDEYVPDEDGTTEMHNPAYALIEPNLPLASPYHKGAGEESKFARKSNTIIKVHQALPGQDALPIAQRAKVGGGTLPANAVRLRKRPDRNNGWSSVSRDYLTYSSNPGAWSGAVPDPLSLNTNLYVSFHALRRTDDTDPKSDLVVNTTTIPDPHGDAGDTITVSEVIQEDVYMASGFDADGTQAMVPGSFPALLRAEFDEMFAGHPYEADGSGNVNSGMIDQRIKTMAPAADRPKANLNLAEINLAAFARMIESYQGDTFTDYRTPDKYNGVVYVELPLDPAFTPRSDKITKAVDNLAVFVTQGGGSDPYLGRVPDPDFNHATGRDAGFTLATNGPLYVRGHFNADGTISSGDHASYMQPDNTADPNPPVCLAADAFTILSPNFRLENTKTNGKPAAASTEFCGAIVAGLMPTNKSGQAVSSGGSHNFPRFLESWSGDKFRYRGSLVALYESEIQRFPWSTGYYDPPTREWGFYSEFAQGNYPPGTPNVRSYRKMDFRYLTKTEYDAKLRALPWSVASN